MVDNLVVKRGYVQYPTRFPKQVKTSVLFDYILFPITCVFYNQLTKDSRIIQCLLKVLYFSIPMTIAELWLEKIHALLNIKMDGIGQQLFILSLFPYYWLDLQCLL